jgi:hypothetical protein
MFFSALRSSSRSLSRSGLLLVALVATFCVLFAAASAGAATNGIGVTTPRSGATLTDTAVIKAKVSRAIAPTTARVEVWVGVNRVATDWAAPYNFNVDTTQLDDGKYEFRVRAVLKRGSGGSTSRSRTYSRMIKVYVANRTQAKPKKPTTTVTPTAATSIPTGATSTPTGATSTPGPLPTPTEPTSTPPPADTTAPNPASIVSGAAGWRTVFAY